jgi:hypothetical protein
MKQKLYEQFAGWVGRRRRSGKTDNDDLLDIAKWKVSVPDFMNHTNPAYIDTSISAKQYNENEEKRKAKQAKLIVILPAALSPSETEQTQEIVFRPKDRMTTVLKNIKKKFGISYQIDLTHSNSERVINLFTLADVAGLQNGSVVTIHRTRSESSTESTESVVNSITVRVQCLSSSKLWSTTLPATASTSHLYFQFQTEKQYTHGSFVLHRSDGSRISRFTTLSELHLRENEVLIYTPIDAITIDVKWLDDKRTPQNKRVYVEASATTDKLKDILREELLLDFNPIITVPNVHTDGAEHLDEITETGTLEVLIRRIGQESWDNTTFDTIPIPGQITAVVLGDSITRTLTMEIGPDSMVADFANMVYENFPEHKGKMMEDRIGLPYRLTEMATTVVPASGLLSMRISPTLEYSPEHVARAVGFIAAMRSTTAEELLNGPFSSFRP